MPRLMLLEETTAVNATTYAGLSAVGDLIHARSVVEAMAQCAALAPDVIIADCTIAKTPITEILPDLKASAPQTPIIVMAKTDSAEATVAKMQRGAFSVLIKPVEVGDLQKAVSLALASLEGTQDARGLVPESDNDTAVADSVTIPINATLREAEEAFIEAVIRRHDGAMSAAARSLGISASTLYRRQERKPGK